MTAFRGSDETLDAEIATLESMTKIRVRRAARELRELDRDLRELRREKARRRALASVPATVPAAAAESDASS